MPVNNLIFDLGGVILNIDVNKTLKAFAHLGMKGIKEDRDKQLEWLFKLEKGHSTPEEFRENVRNHLGNHLDDVTIDKAWTAMLLDIPAERIEYLLELRKKYRIYLLSNTNEIHRQWFHRLFREQFGYSFYDLFERNFYSHEMGLRKPDPAIYHKVLQETGLEPGETLFIDDMPENIEAAESVGLKGLHIEPGTLLDVLPNVLNQF